ncbi:MAG: hypothetical protein IT579_20760 [Verrucomicrobia subdivision 3 bacterium]|nr:hypothetical protein [Limisphaerales bacterium]
MAGPTLDRKLTAARSTRVEFALATPADDPDIRRLLRENPMPGRIALTFEREPDYFADADLPQTEKQTIIARERGRAVCVGNCSLRQRVVNGRACRVGYLGGLRLDARVAGRFDILRRGYEFFRELQADNPADYYFTSIAADNLPARKFLERGLPGMPAYEFASEFLTLLLPVKQQAQTRKAREAETADSSEMLKFLEEQDRHHQFAECWTARELVALSKLGLNAEQFRCERVDGRIAAVAAVWDQRAFKQTVIRGYSPWLALARPALNCFARLLGTPGLPPIGATLAQAFVSHLAVDPKEPEALTTLILKAREAVADKGIEFLTLGFSANDPRLALLRNKFRSREYLSRIYLVRWPDLGASLDDLDGRCLGLEVALL